MTKDEARIILLSIAKSIENGDLAPCEYFQKTSPEYCSRYKEVVPTEIRSAASLLKIKSRLGEAEKNFLLKFKEAGGLISWHKLTKSEKRLMRKLIKKGYITYAGPKVKGSPVKAAMVTAWNYINSCADLFWMAAGFMVGVMIAILVLKQLLQK